MQIEKISFKESNYCNIFIIKKKHAQQVQAQIFNSAHLMEFSCS